MQNSGRILHLDIYDYSGNKLCPLYDNHSDVSGQATDIYVTTERNGWKELSFTLPSTCNTETGSESNFRLNYLKADFMIRLIDDKEIDWFIISEPKVIHNAFSKNVQVTAGHVCQLLKLKNLGLEFSDDEGNNIGTAQQLAETILNGTGWTVGYVYPFAEKDGKTKYRSIKASAKTGAFKLMSMMCNLFDAKPVYHGGTRTVDVVPINPFSEPAAGQVPDLALADGVVELYYGKNVSNVTRTLNTENMVTKLYAYGAYGDKTSGYCGLDECVHSEHTFILSSNLTAGTVYFFTFEDDAGVSLTYHFTAKNNVSLDSKLVYSTLDPSTMLYIWDEENKAAYPVTKGTNGEALPAVLTSNRDVKNWFQFVMDFNYYREVGLLTDDMIQIIADYQRTAPAKYEDVSNASLQMSEAQSELSKTIGVIDFCKLDIDRYKSSIADGYISVVLNKNTYNDGVIYRTDYDKSNDNYFEWNVTESLNSDGDPLNAAASIIYIIHNTNPVTWDKAYLRKIDNEDNPTELELWAPAGSININNADTDQFYLFSYNGINGHLGTLESNDESAVMSLEEAVRVVTVDHPVIFTEDEPITMPTSNINGYGWLWKYDSNKTPSEFYFTYKDEGDTGWNFVYFQDSDPGGAESNSYWYNWRTAVLKRRVNNSWKTLDTSAQKKIAELFSTVYMFGKARDRYYQGLYENYKYTIPQESTLAAGNYYIENEYNSYWAFTTTEQLNAGDSLEYNFDYAWITQIKDGISTTLKPKGYRFDNVNYHSSNVIADKTIEDGGINTTDGSLEDNTDSSKRWRSQSCVSIVPNTNYTITGSSSNIYIHFYDDKKNWLSCMSATSSFISPANCMFIRLCGNGEKSSVESSYKNISIGATQINGVIVIEDLNYIKLSPIATSGEVIGLMSCVEKFVEYANLTYDNYYKELKEAQNVITTLEKQMTSAIGDLYREGWWQDASYVDGDEDKLYIDTLDNLKQVSRPEATYSITYLDMYDSNQENKDYCASEETAGIRWPDLSIMSAAHLVDPEIAVNAWAFMDKISKCYDKPWLTKITINTNLSTIAQHSFTDVMTNIANVAGEIKGKTSYYDKTIGSMVTNDKVNSISANLNKTEKELLSTYTRVEEIGGTVVTHATKIKQNENEIYAEATRATGKEEELSTQIKITAEGLDAEVTRATEAEGTLSSNIKVNADKISAEVTRAKDAESLIVQTAEGINSRVQNIEGSSIISQTAEAIRAVVRDKDENNEFHTSSVSVSKNGVAISTGGTFTVKSGNFELDEDGKVFANNAVISGTLYSKSYPVLTSQDIYFGTVEPTSKHLNMIWIKPGVPASSGGSGDSGSSTPSPTYATATYSAYVDKSGIRDYLGGNENASTVKNVTLYGTGASTSSTTCHYVVKFPVYLKEYTIDNSIKTGGTLKVIISNGSNEIELSKVVTVDEYGHGGSVIELETDDSSWIASGNTITITGYVERYNTSKYSRSEFLNNSGTISVECTAT